MPDQINFLLVGGNGFLGRQIAPRLVALGHSVTISTREPQNLPQSVPDEIRVISNAVAEENVGLFDVVVVLSVVNNNVSASEEEVRAVNVVYPLSLARKVANADRSILIAFGSAHADDPGRTDLYSASKRELRKALAQMESVASRLYIIPPAYGDQFVRKLRQVDRLPDFLRRGAISFVGALKPLVHVDLIVAQMVREVDNARPTKGLIVRRLADDQSSNLVYEAATRGADLLLAALVLIGLFWVMVPIALLIRVGSKGPALFLQPRVGRHGKVFICCKFRTMRVGAPQVATHDASPGLTTPLGRQLRKWKLDELPQVINVIMNRMSWVGPRPNLPIQTELTEERRKRGVLEVRPGITGLAQTRGIDMSDPVRLADTDAEFLFLRSIPLYCLLLLKTFLGRGRGDRIR